MEMESNDKSSAIKSKIKVKLDENQVSEKILLVQEKIKFNADILKKFINDLKPHLSPDFQKALKTINFQYQGFMNYDVTLEDRVKLRINNATTLISSGLIDVFVRDLMKLFDQVPDLSGKNEVDESLYETIKKIMYIFFNYSDASNVFGNELCKKDKLLNLYYRILASTQHAVGDHTITKNFTEMVRTMIATLYNTVLYDSEENLQKIRQMKFLDIVKTFLNSAIEKIKISSLLFTAYVANEGDSMLFKSDQRSIKYLLNLLSDSMKLKSARAKGLSTEELGKGILKLSKNDENKQLLVDLGVLPSLKKLMEKDSIKYKEISLSILWSLAFDDRNREIIKKDFAPVLDEMKGYLSTHGTETGQEREMAQDVIIDRNRRISIDSYENLMFDDSVVNKMKNQKGGSRPSLNPLLNKSVPVEAVYTSPITPEGRLSSKCSQILNGLAWTLKEGQPSALKIGPLVQDSISGGKVADGHIMISYCRINKEVVMKIYNALKDRELELWIDKYNMAENENLMESMAQAVENSTCVIVCISNAYKDSDNCRAEAQYAVTKKKQLIPVMVQEGYRPDGWLGICISGLMYCDFVGKHPFKETFKDLLNQLKRISLPKNEREKIKHHKPKVDATDHVTPINTPTETTDPHSKFDIATWSNAQVGEWFREIGIKKVIWKSNYDGNELSFLKTLSETSLDSFLQISENKLGLTDLRDLRIFFENLRRL